jgi:hypothetical protein
MEKIHKSELFVVPQFERVQKMRAVIPEWMSELASNQMLVIGLPPVLGPWSDAVPLVVGGHMITEFIKPPENPQLPLGDGRGNPDTPS